MSSGGADADGGSLFTTRWEGTADAKPQLRVKLGAGGGLEALAWMVQRVVPRG